MSQHWTKLIEEFEELEEKELVKSVKHRKPKLNHKKATQLKENKKNGIKYPKKAKR